MGFSTPSVRVGRPLITWQSLPGSTELDGRIHNRYAKRDASVRNLSLRQTPSCRLKGDLGPSSLYYPRTPVHASTGRNVISLLGLTRHRAPLIVSAKYANHMRREREKLAPASLARNLNSSFTGNAFLRFWVQAYRFVESSWFSREYSPPPPLWRLRNKRRKDIASRRRNFNSASGPGERCSETSVDPLKNHCQESVDGNRNSI